MPTSRKGKQHGKSSEIYGLIESGGSGGSHSRQRYRDRRLGKGVLSGHRAALGRGAGSNCVGGDLPEVRRSDRIDFERCGAGLNNKEETRDTKSGEGPQVSPGSEKNA